MKDVIKEGIERSGVGVNIDTPLSSLLRVRVYEQGFEDGTSDLSTTNCTQAVQSTEVYAGNYALDVTIPAGNTGHIDTPMRPVSPNQRVTFTFAHKEDENITSVKLIVVWYRENLHVIDTEEFDLTPSTSWQLDSRTVAAPKNAAYMGLRMEATAGASEGHVYLDSMIMDLVGQVLSVDSEGNLKVTDESAQTPTNGGTLQVVATSTPTPLGSQKVRMITIKADKGNTDSVWIGFDSSINSSTGFPLDPGESIDIVIDDLSKVYVMSPSTAQKIYVMWVQ